MSGNTSVASRPSPLHIGRKCTSMNWRITILLKPKKKKKKSARQNEQRQPRDFAYRGDVNRKETIHDMINGVSIRCSEEEPIAHLIKIQQFPLWTCVAHPKPWGMHSHSTNCTAKKTFFPCCDFVYFPTLYSFQLQESGQQGAQTWKHRGFQKWKLSAPQATRSQYHVRW